MSLTGMTQHDREELATRLIRELEVRFRGVAKRAYTAAGVNSATWARAVNAQSIKPHTQAEIVANLWPETHGDWRKIPDADQPEPNVMEMLRELQHRMEAQEREIRALKKSRAG